MEKLAIAICISAIIILSGIGMYQAANLQGTQNTIDSQCNIINDLKDTIKSKDDSIDGLHEEIDKWIEKYENNPKVVYNNETEYIYKNNTEYIYRNETIFLSDAIFDVNRDGKINHEDVCSVWGYINKGLLPAEELFYSVYDNAWEYLYDVNADGKVNVLDVELILEHSD